jgi:hypothetical protein
VGTALASVARKETDWKLTFARAEKETRFTWRGKERRFFLVAVAALSCGMQGKAGGEPPPQTPAHIYTYPR